jgi:hypothetical protein
LLEETLEEEKQADQKLTELAHEINQQATEAEGGAYETGEEAEKRAGSGARRPGGPKSRRAA